MKTALRILLSNWINALGIIVTAYLNTFLMTFIISPEQGSDRMEIWLFGSLYLIFGYGIMFWSGFLAAIILLDLALILPSKKRLKEKLTLEWLLIIPPFIYWAFKYDYWLWLMLSASFLITQLIRKNEIEKIRKTWPNKV